MTTGRWTGLRDWQNAAARPEEPAQWDGWGANTGLRTGEIIALDFDVKVDTSDKSAGAARARMLLGNVHTALADALGVADSKLARRWRENSSSCVIFFRWSGEPAAKRIWSLLDPQSGSSFRIELLARGQQVVIAGRHVSGAVLQSNLAELEIDGLPEIDAARLDIIETAMESAAAAAGFLWNPVSRSSAEPTNSPRSFLSDYEAVTREVWRRRHDWIPPLLPHCVATPPQGEWSATSGDLERSLEERLVIFDPMREPGAYDFGTERSHSPLSFIKEFGSIGPDGDIAFGGCPAYGRDGDQDFAVIGEVSSDIRRPSTAEALSWLGRQLAGEAFASFPEGVSWSQALPRIAGAVGLSWQDLTTAWVLLWGDAGTWPAGLSDMGIERDRVVGPAYYTWSSTQISEHVPIIAALRAIAPDAAEMIEMAHNVLGNLPAGYDRLIENTRREAVLKSLTTALPEIAVALPEAAVPETDQSWREPIDIFGDGDPELMSQLPKECMPDALQEYALDVADRMGVSPVFAGAAALAVASGAVGGHIQLQPKARDTEWTVPPFLWILLIEDPGGKKTPLIRAMTAPLVSLDGERAREDVPKRDRWAAESRQKRKSVPPGPRPPLRKTMVDSFTVEGLRDVLSENPRGVLASADEVAGLIGGLDQYKPTGGSDRADLLKLMDGGARTFDRVNRSIRVPCWGAAMLAGTQPKKLAQMAKTLDPDGLLQRFIPIVGDGLRRPEVDREPNVDARTAYEDTIAGLASSDPSFDRSVVRLSAEAQAVRERVEHRIRALMDMQTASDAWKGHLSKWSGFYPRILLVFHAVDLWTRKSRFDDSDLVSGEIAVRAERFANLLLAHAIRFYETIIGGDPGTRAADIASDVILAKVVDGTDKLSRRDLYQAHRAWRPDQPDARQLYLGMQRMESFGWCRSVPGASGSEVWQLNPAIKERFLGRAEAAKRRRENEYLRVQVAVAERRTLLGRTAN